MNMLGRVAAVFLMLVIFSMDFSSLAWANLVGWVVMLLFEVPLLLKQIKLLSKDGKS
jgi:hypothetical protein